MLNGFIEDYILKNPEWKQDVIPEIMDVADFIDPDIAEKLEALEREESVYKPRAITRAKTKRWVSAITSPSGVITMHSTV